MKAIKTIILLVAVCFAGLVEAQDYKVSKNPMVNASFVRADNLGGYYIVYQTKILKYNNKNVLECTYSNNNYGEITNVDVTDPLKIIVFFKDFGIICFLDNKLTIKGDPISLFDKGIQQPLYVCSSVDNGFWVYDQQKSKLVRFDKNLVQTNTAEYINQSIGQLINPSFMIEADNMLYVYDSKLGILLFDRYGNYDKTLAFINIVSFDVNNDVLMIFKDLKYYRYNMKTFEESSKPIPEENAKCIVFKNKRFYILTDNEIIFYD